MGTVRAMVPPLRQQRQNTCWLTCWRMLAMYRNSRGRPLNEASQLLLDDDFVERFRDLDRTIRASEIGRIGRMFGMSAIEIPGFTHRSPGDLLDPAGYRILRRRGPFMFCGWLLGRLGHAVVINGWVSNESSGEETVQFIDPRQGRYQQIAFSSFIDAFPPMGAPLLVY